MILDKSKDKNPKDNNGITPLHLAALYGRTNFFKAILDQAEDKNPKDLVGKTPFQVAVNHGQKEICQMIMDNCDDIKKILG